MFEIVLTIFLYVCFLHNPLWKCTTNASKNGKNYEVQKKETVDGGQRRYDAKYKK
jgi:hypothetical protein